MTTPAFRFTCWLCGLEIDVAAPGMLYLRGEDLEEAEMDQATWPPPPPADIADSELAWVDSRAGWVTAHAACRPRDAYESHYEIPLGEFRHERDALIWTLRLMSEPWLERTTWRRQVGALVDEDEGPFPKS